MVGNKPKIEIIQIGLDNLDIAKEIRERTDAITVDTNRFANLQPVSKKKREAAQWDSKIQKAVELLFAAMAEDRLVSSDEIISTAEIDKKQLGGFTLRVQKYLRGDDDWTLRKKRIKNVMHYHLVRFSA